MIRNIGKIARFPDPRSSGSRSRAGAPALTAHARADSRRREARALSYPRAIRRALVCRWHVTDAGRLECIWQIERVDGASADEPQSRRMMVRPLMKRVRRSSAGRRH